MTILSPLYNFIMQSRREMQERNIQRLVKLLKDKQSNKQELEEEVIFMLNNYQAWDQLLTLAILAIRNFGFGVLLVLKNVFVKCNNLNKSSSWKMAVVEWNAITLISPYHIDFFSELQFLKKSSKSQLKYAKKQTKEDIDVAVRQRSNQLRDYLLKIRKLDQRFQKIEIKNFINLQDVLSDLKELHLKLRPPLDSFGRIYERLYFDNIIDTLQNLKRSLVLARGQINLIDKVIQKVQAILDEDELYQKQQMKIKMLDDSFSQSFETYPQEQAEEFNYPYPTYNFENHYASIKIPKKGALIKRENEEKTNTKKKIFKNCPLCCRTSFFQGQLIEEAESERRQYKNYKLPLDEQTTGIICKTIVAFLNYLGGNIYLGIKEDVEKKRTVVGVTITEQKKEELLTEIRTLCSKITPDIVLSKFYQVRFIPVCKISEKPVLGKYVVKITVQMGNPKEVYHCMLKDGNRACFRTENEVLVRDPRYDLAKILEVQKLRCENPRKEKPEHQGSCPEPNEGLPKY